MKHEIIYTGDYALIVSDEDIKDVRPHNGKYHLEDGLIVNKFPDYLTDLNACKLIIGYKPLNHSAWVLEGVPLLPEFNQQDDVEEVANTLFRNKIDNLEEIHSDYILGFQEGYRKAKETYKYTEDDLRKAFNAGLMNRYSRTGEAVAENEVIQSLQQPKLPKYFECEYKPITPHKYTVDDHLETELKTTTNSQGQTELVGTYTF